MSRIDDLNAWRAFVVFAKAGTLSGAAKVLDVEVSSVSRAIAALEKSLGCELIRHAARPLTLTDAGKTALKRIEPILRAHESLVESLMEDAKALEGRIRLSSAPGFASRRLAGILERFYAVHPGITIEILSGLQAADVQKGLCEVATLTGMPTLPGLVCMSRGRNVYLPVASPGYVRRHGMPVSPEQLRAHTGFVYAGPVRAETKELFRGGRREAVQFGQAIRSTDILAIRDALLKDMGVAVDMPLVQIHEDLLDGRLVPILPGWFRPPVECFIAAGRAAWHMRRVRVFFEWYARAMQEVFASYEAKVSAIVGLPHDEVAVDRNEIFRT